MTGVPFLSTRLTVTGSGVPTYCLSGVKIMIKQYLSSMYLKKGGNKNTLKAQKINEENSKDKEITDFEKWSVTGLYYYQIGEFLCFFKK